MAERNHGISDSSLFDTQTTDADIQLQRRDAYSDGRFCPPLAALKAHNLLRINQLRVDRHSSLSAYTADDCLDKVARATLLEWLQTKTPHGRFDRECAPNLPQCECNWQQENMGRVDSNKLTWKQMIDLILAQMMAEEFTGGRHFRNLVSPKWHRVGMGFNCKISGSRLTIHLTNDFGP